ncbi:hypothetical protein ES703_122936 [subsurface metagenome]
MGNDRPQGKTIGMPNIQNIESIVKVFLWLYRLSPGKVVVESWCGRGKVVEKSWRDRGAIVEPAGEYNENIGKSDRPDDRGRR